MGLTHSWTEDGQKRLWSRTLGAGHSAILEDGGRLHTTYRPRVTGELGRFNAGLE